MEFVGDIARKTGNPAILAVEAAKTEKAGQIAATSGLFYVPRLLSFDEKKGILEFERLRGLLTIRELILRKDPRLFGILEDAGRALAVVHEQLVLSDEVKHNLPPEWMVRPEENVFLHGDCGFVNLCYHEPSQRLVILDWSTAPLMGRTPTYGSRYFDIFWFVGLLFRGVPGRKLLHWHSEKMATTFLKGYGKRAPINTLNDFKHLIPSICRLQRKIIWCSSQSRSFLGTMVYVVRHAPFFTVQLFMHIRFKLFLHNYLKQK